MSSYPLSSHAVRHPVGSGQGPGGAAHDDHMMATEQKDNLVGSAPQQNEHSSGLEGQRVDGALIGAHAALEKTDQLARSLSLMRATLDATSNGILATDAHGRITTYNEQYVRLWSVPV